MYDRESATKRFETRKVLYKYRPFTPRQLCIAESAHNISILCFLFTSLKISNSGVYSITNICSSKENNTKEDVGLDKFSRERERETACLHTAHHIKFLT